MRLRIVSLNSFCFVSARRDEINKINEMNERETFIKIGFIQRLAFAHSKLLKRGNR